MDSCSNIEDINVTNSQTTNECQVIGLNGRPIGLRRQPTKYPHGLNIMHDQSQYTPNYSRASTLRSDSSINSSSNTNSNRSTWPASKEIESYTTDCSTLESCQQKYKIDMIGVNPEMLAELQVRRYKYPLTANYYLDAPTTTTTVHTPRMLMEYAKRLCKWKYLRWPLIFLACVLLLFGLITYCLWLHDVSVAREKYLLRRQQIQQAIATTNDYNEDFKLVEQQTGDNDATDGSDEDDDLYDAYTSTAEVEEATTIKLPAVKLNKKSETNPLLETTRLHIIEQQTPIKQQKPTTVDLKKIAKVSKEQKYMEFTTTEQEYEDENFDSLVPADSIRFTSGHQNSFGVPIEHDERIMRLLKNLLPIVPPTTSTANPRTQTRVSPTIPPIASSQPTAAMTPMLESGCYSTSLAMCRGVLDYDLTYNASNQLDERATQSFDKLINSNCSTRALEFLCAALEPECRPMHIGQLPPCRRICKAVLEACSIVIANSDLLTELFDCHLYPDSNDPHKCEDPTRRRDYCYDNEFECYDSTCIPYQWQCDNIKDCATGEDEDECLICEQSDEFRCRSNEKCVPDMARCNQKLDCFDGSDEDDCDEYGSGDDALDTANGNDKIIGGLDDSDLNAFPRLYSYASILLPNQTNNNIYAYITASTDEETGTKVQLHEFINRTSGISQEEVTNSVPGETTKGLVNFRDSKEIMMTSDSETKFKYSAARANRSRLSASVNTTPLQPAASNRVRVTSAAPVLPSAATPAPAPAPKLAVEPVPAAATAAAFKSAQTITAARMSSDSTSCAAHELRCVTGECITVSQLCDKHIDCPDGADELMCTYKERKRNQTKITTTKRTGNNAVKITSTMSLTTTTAIPTTTTTTTTASASGVERRAARTTVKLRSRLNKT